MSDYEQYLQNKKKALSNFPSSFIEQVQYDPSSRAVIEALSRNANPYDLLYDILIQNITLQKQLTELTKQMLESPRVFNEIKRQ